MYKDDEKQVIDIVLAFNDALNARNLEGMIALLTPLSVFENTYPAPDGSRFVGLDAIRAFWVDFFQSSSNARIEPEEIFATGNRCVMRWTYHWTEAEGKMGHIRGVDIYRIEDGLIAEKLSYVKG